MLIRIRMVKKDAMVNAELLNNYDEFWMMEAMRIRKICT